MSIKDYTKEDAAKEFGIHYIVRTADYFYKGEMKAGPERFFRCAKTMPIDNVLEIDEVLGHARHQTDRLGRVFETLEEAKEYAIKAKKENYSKFLGRLYDFAQDIVVQELVKRVRSGDEKSEKLVQFAADYERTMSQLPQLKQIVRLMHDERGFNFDYDVQLNEAPATLSVWFNVAANVGDEVYIADIPNNIADTSIRKVTITDLAIKKPINVQSPSHPESKAYSFEAWFAPHNGSELNENLLVAEKQPVITGENAMFLDHKDLAKDRKFGALGFVMGEAVRNDGFDGKVLSLPFKTEAGAKAYVLDMAKETTRQHRKRAKDLAAKFQI